MATHPLGHRHPPQRRQERNALFDHVDHLTRALCRLKDKAIKDSAHTAHNATEKFFDRIMAPGAAVHPLDRATQVPLLRDAIATNTHAAAITRAMEWDERVRELFLAHIERSMFVPHLYEETLRKEIVRFIQYHPIPYHPPARTKT
jgi:hypothetical protein